MRDSSSRPVFWAAVWLAVMLVAVKAWYLGLSSYRLVGPHEFFRWVAAISYPDVLFAVVAWLIGRLLLAVLRTRAVPGAIAFAMSLFVVQGAASVALFGTLAGFPTYPLVRLARHIPLIRSAVSAQLTPQLMALLAVLLLIHLALTFASVRVVRVGSAVLRGAGVVVVLASLAGWVSFGRDSYIHSPWAGRQDKHVAESAHWGFASSLWNVFTGQARATLTGRFDVADLEDFSAPPLSGPLAPAPGRRRPNVILLVLESTPARWTSVYGGPYDTTPVLAAEAAHSLVFDNVYSHIGRSSNSFVAMLMSRYPQIDNRDITVEYPNLAGTPLSTMFRAAGYRTGYVTPSDLTWADWRAFLQPRAFDDIRDLHDAPCTTPLSEWSAEDRCMVDQAIQFIGQEPGRPFFLMAWTGQTHWPYTPAPGAPEIAFKLDQSPDQYEFGNYLNVLHETDRQLARLFDAIRRAGLEQDTLIAITGDHGQAFGEPHTSYGQGQTGYEEDLHVPMMFWFPRNYASGARSTQIGSHVDLAPTIAELAGLVRPSDWQGRSLLQPGHPPRAYFYVAEDRFMLGVREQNWKYLFNLRDGTDELYDLDRDPTEQHSLVSAEPARVARLRERLTAWMEFARRQYGH